MYTISHQRREVYILTTIPKWLSSGETPDVYTPRPNPNPTGMGWDSRVEQPVEFSPFHREELSTIAYYSLMRQPSRTI
ncbi:MAG: hypothetical protein ACRC11_22310 [Xenococcaceae cyanobacterium]